MMIMKFGGTSVGSAQAIQQTTAIICSHASADGAVIVCSAMAGVTDALILCCELAAQGASTYVEVLASLKETHEQCIRALFTESDFERVSSLFVAECDTLAEVLRGIFFIQECSLRTRDLVMSFGERFSCLCVSEYLKNKESRVVLLDARSVIKTNNQFGNAQVFLHESFERIREAVNVSGQLWVVAGFIGSTQKGETTTLGRGGSDYTASLFAAALAADEIQIWTDVDGVLTADPRLIKGAHSIAAMTYEEAMEMSHFGAKVIYPPTMQPAREFGIPIWIKNTFHPEHPGTKISSEIQANGPVKGISCIKQVALLHVCGPGMVGVTGTAGRMFSALAKAHINIMMITQGSSEHSICAVIAPGDAPQALQALKEEFTLQILNREIDEISLQDDLSVIAVVGEQMHHTPGIAGKLFHALGQAHVNIVAIAQGSSERNISMVVRSQDVTSGMQVIHDAFFSEEDTPSNIHLYVAGTGTVGGELLHQLAQLPDAKLRLMGMINSRKMIRQFVAFSSWAQTLDQGESSDLQRFIQEIIADSCSRKVFVDCTASEKVVECYKNLFDAGVSIVAANKKAASHSQAFYDRVIKNRGDVFFGYETTVGAGLPVISTIRSLLETGDRIVEIQGVLSGTLSYLFNTFDGTTSFSVLLSEAQEKGYTEPDPRDDLSGMDVGRKLLILAREIGYACELDDIKVENLTPESCRSLSSTQEFFKILKEQDHTFAQRFNEAQNKGCRLRYIAQLKDHKMHVALASVGPEHPCYHVSGSDNLIAIYTKHYHERPLIIQGPGAGAQVTAAGVLQDVLFSLKHYG